MCQHAYYDNGTKSYGNNIPGYAQGAYFPGDEPGMKCRELGGEACQKDNPAECPAWAQTSIPCPNCMEEQATEPHGIVSVDQLNMLLTHGAEYYCPRCDETYTIERVARIMAEIYQTATHTVDQLQANLDAMGSRLAKIREIAA